MFKELESIGKKKPAEPHGWAGKQFNIQNIFATKVTKKVETTI
jgi:hypothetical protein